MSDFSKLPGPTQKGKNLHWTDEAVESLKILFAAGITDGKSIIKNTGWEL